MATVPLAAVLVLTWPSGAVCASCDPPTRAVVATEPSVDETWIPPPDLVLEVPPLAEPAPAAPVPTPLPAEPAPAPPPEQAPPEPPSGEVLGGQPGAAEVNQFRAASGLAPLTWDDSMAAKAVAWSQHMASEGHLSHSTLSDGMPGGWSVLGENVAYNGSVAAALAALEASPAHRDNLLDPRFTRFAVGVVVVDGRVWVTQVFYG